MFLIACQKESASIFKGPTPTEQVAVTKVNAWLEKQKSLSTVSGTKKIQALVNSLDLSKLRIEQLNEKERMFVVPLTRSGQSSIQTESNTLNYLLVFEDENQNIRKSFLVKYSSENGVSSLPANTFHNIYNNKEKVIDGIFGYNNIYGTFQYDMGFKDGRLNRYKVYQKGNNGNGANNEGGGNSTEACIDWYLVTTITYLDGQIEQYSEYQYTTCSSCMPWIECATQDVLEGSTGGAITLEPITKPINWRVGIAQNNYWQVWAYGKIKGVKVRNEPGGGHITDIEHSASQIFNEAGSTGVWQQLDATAWRSAQNQRADCSVSGKISFSNQSIPNVQVSGSEFWLFISTF